MGSKNIVRRNHVAYIATFFLSAFLMVACGGTDEPKAPVRLLAKATVIGGTATFSGPRSNYVIAKTGANYVVTDIVGSDGTQQFSSIQSLRFSDVSVNLTIADKTRTISPTDLTLLIELYVAFFNRVPDADGLAYWIDQFKSGMGINQIADNFYNAGVQYANLTGYSATMTNSEFVRTIYKNVLARSGSTAPPDGDVNYWASQLASGAATKGSLVKAILTAAHTYKGDATWGWVANLLDNKYIVGHQFAVTQGLTYLDSAESITKSMAIAAAAADLKTVTTISPNKSSLSFTATIGGATENSAFEVALPPWLNNIATSVRYVSGPSGWLSLTSSSPGRYTVAATGANLAPGKYTAEIVLKSGYLASDLVIPVSLMAKAASWSVAGTTSFNVDRDTTLANLEQGISVNVPDLPSQGWSASTSSSWLKVLNSSGTTGSSQLRVAIDKTELSKLPNFGAYSAVVTITLASGVIAPTTLTFTLDKNLPELKFVSPHTRLPSQGGLFVLRGRGLNSVVNLEKVLRIGGATLQNMTRVSDTQVRLMLNPGTQGDVTIALDNALELDVSTVVVKTTPSKTLTYRAISTQGNKGGLIFDPERDAIYSVNKTLGSLMKFSYNNGAWSTSSVSVPSIESVAMSPDGKTVVTTATSGKLTLHNADNLSVQESYTASYIGGYELNSLPTLAMTNSGRAYFQGDTWSSGLNYFDLVSRTFGTVNNGQNFNFYGGPWFSVSGDGDRLAIVQSASISPSPKMLYMDSIDEVPKENPAGLTFWYEAAQSLHGERFIEGTGKVWDRDFNLIGNISIPNANYFGRTPVFSPDGKRVYILAYSQAGLSPGSSVTPRVYIFDSSTRVVTTSDLPLIGSFDIADYPTCRISDYYCNTRALGTISPDGKTLFFIGDAKLVVVPVPGT